MADRGANEKVAGAIHSRVVSSANAAMEGAAAGESDTAARGPSMGVDERLSPIGGYNCRTRLAVAVRLVADGHDVVLEPSLVSFTDTASGPIERLRRRRYRWSRGAVRALRRPYRHGDGASMQAGAREHARR